MKKGSKSMTENLTNTQSLKKTPANYLLQNFILSGVKRDCWIYIPSNYDKKRLYSNDIFQREGYGF